MTINPKFKLGQRVYHVLGGEDGVGVVVGYAVRPTSLMRKISLIIHAETHPPVAIMTVQEANKGN